MTGCPDDPVGVGGGTGDGGDSTGTGSGTDASEGPVASTSVVDETGASGCDSTATDSMGSDTTATASDTDSGSSSSGDPEVCGDDMAVGSEVCDGSDLAGADCGSQGFDGGTLACAVGCDAYDTSGCFVCGNDAIEDVEVCDGADLGGQTCGMQGFDGGTLGCQGDCSGYDTSGCFACGDDTIGGMEVCDGTDLGGQTCLTQGFDSGTLACQLDCSAYDTSGCFDCGNDMIEGMEVCDGTDLAGQTCGTQGFDGGTLACQVDCSAYDTMGCTMCGDGMIEGTEECDGANLGGQTCGTQGFDGGMLSCQGDCTFNTAMCISYTGDCCANNGTPGCDDSACTAAVCAADPSCCGFAWDAGCAAAAVVEPACQDVGGSCPQCGDDLIEGLEVCDGINLAGEDCVTLGFDTGTLGCQGDCSDYDLSMCISYMGDCCAANGSPGCDDLGCTAAVCAFDPTCCSGSWDAACAAAAEFEPACQDVGGSCPACGNDMIEGLEVCDGTDLAGDDCMMQGFDGGTLSCQPDCSAIDTSTCQNIGFGDCLSNLPAVACLPEEQCITDLAMPPTQGVCTDVMCTSVTDCPLAQPGGTAPVLCTDVTGEGINECIMSCALPGQNCPPGMICALGIACAWPAP